MGAVAGILDQGSGLDLDSIVGADQTLDPHQGRGGADGAKHLPVGGGYCFPIGHISDIDAGADHISQAGSCRLEGTLDLGQDVAGLSTGIPDGNSLALFVSGHSAGDFDPGSDPKGTGVADSGFPGGAR